ncbi:MAG: winged helix-turn-helix transcriptional regulator [bacterium]|nr:winged helix-turn-helix transcriptional regulator [bacterium]
MAHLFIEPKEISLEDLAKRTGYSLSAVSTAMKFLERAGIVKRMKKPKSRKTYFFMESDLMTIFTEHIKRKYEKVIIPTKQKLPAIIERYKSEKSKDSKEELKILQNYYKSVMISEKVLENMAETLDKLTNGANRT